MKVSVKLLTKFLARRLGIVMNHLVNETQSAFIKTRKMSVRILITIEVYLALKYKNSEGVIMKLDFAKAFDTVN